MADDADAQIQAAMDLLAQAAAQGNAPALQPIGVPADFVATRNRSLSQHPLAGVPTPPRYFDGDDWVPASLPGPRIAELQRQMVAAGLIPKGASYRNGYWDEVSRNGYRQLLAEANASGLSAQQQVKVRQDTTQANKPEFQAPVRLKRDPAAIRSSVRALMAEVIGPDREPTDAELAELTGALERIDGEAYDASTAAARAEFDQETAAAEGAPATAAPVVEDVDPAARFEELLRSKYRPEIEMREGIADMTAGRDNAMGNIFAIDRMIGV